ncbi:MAG: hypothetical protein RR817_10355 [Niameybacter sp.]
MTPYEMVFDSFLDLIIRDDTFFVKNPDANLVNTMAEQRLLKLMKHALTNLMMVRDNKNFEINFMKICDDISWQFTEDLNAMEVDLIAYFMWQVYIDEEYTYRFRELRRLGFTDKDINQFSPANSITQFNKAVYSLKQENINRVKAYKSRRRDDFTFKRFNFDFE